MTLGYDLSDQHAQLRETVRAFAEGRLAPVAEQLDREGRFPAELVQAAAELGLLGIPLPESAGGVGFRHGRLRDRDRGAGAGRQLLRDHGGRAHLAGHDADPPVRQRAAEGTLARRPGLRPRPGRVRADGGGRRLRRRCDAHHRAAGGRRVGDRRLQDVHHQRRHAVVEAGDDHRAHRARRGVEHRGRERHRRLRPVAAAEEDGVALVGHARADLHGLPGARAEPAGPPRRGLPPVPRDPGRRPHQRGRAGAGHGPGRVRDGAQLRPPARAVRAPDRVASRPSSSSWPTWRPRSRRPATWSTRRHG